MKIVVIGGSGLIGSRVASQLEQLGHEVIAASPRTGVNTLTGEGLAAALKGAEVVVDVANSPSFEDKAVLEFFETSGKNLHAAEIAAGVKHHVALSVVGTERLQASGYFRAKLAQEKLIEQSGVPYTIVRATQFFEFLSGIAQTSVQGNVIRLSTASLQPMAADDVADAVVAAASSAPTNAMHEVAGPEKASTEAFVSRYLSAVSDTRKIESDASARYFGMALQEDSLTPAAGARLGTTTLASWLAKL